MKKKYESIKDLQEKIDEYFNSTKLVAPTAFRVYLGISKHLLATWKKTNEPYFNLIKTHEEKILAKIEEYAIYGMAHPDIQSEMVKVTPVKTWYADKFNNKGELIAKGSVKSEGVNVQVIGKFNQVGAMFTLRAFKPEQYVPELQDVKQLAEPITVIGINKSERKLIGDITIQEHKEK